MACARSAALSLLRIGFLILVVGTLAECGPDINEKPVAFLQVKSSSFVGDTIPNKYEGSRENTPCNGQDISPQLSWSPPPEGTQSFVLIVIDKDSPLWFNFVHWVLYDLSPDKRELPEGIAKRGELQDGSRQGNNGFDKIGYAGPCPPGHSPHRYLFHLYALNARLNLPAAVSKSQVEKAMKGHVLASGEIVGKYQH